MARRIELQLRQEAIKKGLKGLRAKAYVKGEMHRIIKRKGKK